VRGASGRQRYNVLGAVDSQTKKITTITNETYITAPTGNYSGPLSLIRIS
jgi:hypothetical protein